MLKTIKLEGLHTHLFLQTVILIESETRGNLRETRTVLFHNHIIKWGKKKRSKQKLQEKNWTQRSLCDRCHVLKGSHACAEGWGSIGWRYSDVQVVSDLEALRLQREGVFRALPTRHRAANIFQPGKKKEREAHVWIHTYVSHICCASPLQWTNL